MNKKPNRSIHPDEKIKLWVKAGGRCEICNEYLLKDKLSAREFNFAEKAHNVGIGSGKSPRSKSPLTTKERNTEENLLLLCPKHHKMVDNKKFAGEFTVERLKEYKTNHEKRIQYVTGFTNERKSVVLRMMNRIKQHSIAVSNEEVRIALDTCERRFPEYLLSTEKNVEINLTGMPDKVSPSYWKIGQQKIDDVITKQLEPKADEKIIKHISIFALARIPLLIYLGYRLGDKIPIDVYQKQRNENEDWNWCRDKKAVTFAYKKIQEGNPKSKKIILLAAISGKIHLTDLPSFVTSEYTIYEITPTEVEPHRDIINDKKTLINFKNSYQRLMRLIEKEHGGSNELLLFPALPLSAAVYCGRELLQDTSPVLTIFDRENSKYVKTFSINNKKKR